MHLKLTLFNAISGTYFSKGTAYAQVLPALRIAGDVDVLQST